MEVLAVIAAYLAIGTVIGRILFVKVLGDSPRQIIGHHVNEFGYRREKEELVDSPQLVSATNYAIGALFIWWLALPLFLMQSPTKTEKIQIRRAEMEKLQEEMKALESKYDLTFNPTYTTGGIIK